MISFIKKNKLIIAISAVIATALVAAFIFGGSLSKNTTEQQAQSSVVNSNTEKSSTETASTAGEESSLIASEPTAATSSSSASQATGSSTAATSASSATPSPSAAANNHSAGSSAGNHSPEKSESAVKAAEQKTTDPPKTSPAPTSAPPATKPIPQEKTTASTEKICTVSISCAAALARIDSLDDDVAEVIPSDGVILSQTTEKFTEGENVFDILSRVCKRKKIHMEYTTTPLYNTAYIEGIGNLYEFDCGSGSGWMYRVNGVFPNYGCSRYTVHNGDKIEWLYTCDLGRDIGGDNIRYND